MRAQKSSLIVVDPENGLYHPTKEINPYLLFFNDKKIEQEYFEYCIQKYRSLGYVICFIQIIIFITDFIRLFQTNEFPQNDLIFLVIMIILTIILLIILYFKQSLFNIIYSFYYLSYITLLGWSMYEENKDTSDDNTDVGDVAKIEIFTFSFAVSTILTLGITGSNYILKNLLFTYGTILFYVARAISQGTQYQAIVRIVLIVLLFYYVTYYREYSHRLSYLKQKQIDSYNEIMNNQIPHCLFAAKYNSSEQRLEFFQCNTRAQKEFNINGNEDFQKFISNSYVIPNSEKIEKSQGSAHGTLNSNKYNEQSWENSLKTKIRQLILQKSMADQKQLQKNREEDGYVITQNQNLNNNSPIIKLKLRQQEGISIENKINVRLSIFKLHEYYVIITIDRNRNKKNKFKKENRSKSTRHIMLGSKDKKIKPFDYFQDLNNEVTLHLPKISSPKRYPISSSITQNNNQNTWQPTSILQTATSPKFQQKGNTLLPSSSLKQSPQLQAQPHKGLPDDDQYIRKFSYPTNTYSNNLRQNNRQTLSFSNHIETITPVSNSQNVGFNTPSVKNIDLNTTLKNDGNSIGSRRKSIFNGRSISTGNYLNYITQKKLSLSGLGNRKPVNSVNSISSTCLPPSSILTTKPRTTSFAIIDQQFQQNKRASHGSVRSNANNNFNSFNCSQNMNNSPSENKGIMKEQMFDICFETIAETLQLIQRYKSIAPDFRNSKILSHFLPQQNQQISINPQSQMYQSNSNIEQLHYEAFEKYTQCIMQQILITNSNFMKFTRLIFNQFNLKYSPFNASELVHFLKDQIQPVLVEKKIQLHLQDDLDVQIYSDPNTLKLILVNLLIYCSKFLNELQYVAVKFSIQEEDQTFKIQLLMPHHDNHAFNNIDTLHQLSLNQIQKDYSIFQKFHVDLRVAFTMIKKLNNDNLDLSDYLKFTKAEPGNNHMYLTFTVPSHYNPPQSYCEFPILLNTENNFDNLTHAQTAAFQRKSQDTINLFDRDNLKVHNDICQNTFQNIDTRETKNTEECLLEDSISSFERWVTIKQYYAHNTDRPIKLIV